MANAGSQSRKWTDALRKKGVKFLIPAPSARSLRHTAFHLQHVGPAIELVCVGAVLYVLQGGETQTKHPVQNGQRQRHRWRDKKHLQWKYSSFLIPPPADGQPCFHRTPAGTEPRQDPTSCKRVSGDAIRRGHSTNRFHANKNNKSRSKKLFSGGEWRSLLCTSLARVTCLAVTSYEVAEVNTSVTISLDKLH